MYIVSGQGRVSPASTEYTIQALQDYRAGVRVGTQAVMAEAVRGLDDAALTALAHYLAHFRP